MGQKVNPHGLRVGVIKDWDSRWYAREDKVGDLVVEDYNIRKYLKSTLYSAGIAKINVGTELRQTYEFALQESGNDVSFAQDALYKRTRAYIADYLFNTNLKDLLFG